MTYANRFKLIAVFFTILISHPVNASFITYEGGLATEAAWRAAVGTYSFEGFESYTGGTAITSLSSVGLQFDPLVGSTQPSIYVHHTDDTPSGTRQLALFPNGTPTTGFRYVDMIARPIAGTNIYAFGFWNGDPQGDMVVRVFDKSDNLIGTITALINTGSKPSLSNSFAGFISSVPIGRLEFEGNTGDGWNHIDDIQVATIPVPAAFYLFGSGLLGLIGICRTKKAA